MTLWISDVAKLSPKLEQGARSLSNRATPAGLAKGGVTGIALAAFVFHAAVAENGPPQPQVTVATPLPRRIPQWDEYTGRFEALQRVEVRPRVSGYIAEIHFSDGAIVAKGDPLFTI